MKRRDGILVIVALVVAFCFMLGQPAMAALEGPTQIPPYGVYFVDTDTGDIDNKEQWGREGGRTFEFTVYDASNYDQLIWEPSHVAIAFDGEIDLPDETLTYYTNDGGTAVWIGQTQVYMLVAGVYSWVSVDTELRLTVRDIDDNIVPYSVPVDDPSFDLTSLTPNSSDEVYFSAQLEMRARMPSYDSVTALCSDSGGPVNYSTPPTIGEFYPALNVFDCLQTNPSYDGLALTEFEYGFWHELSSIVDWGLNEHDAHMTALASSIQTTVDNTNVEVTFLFEDWTPRITGLITDHAGIRDQLAIMGGAVNNVNTAVNNVNTIVSNLSFPELDLTSLAERVDRLPTNDMLFLMFGLEPFIEDEELQGLFPLVSDNSPLYQAITPLNDKADALLEAVANITLDFTPVETALQTNATTIQDAVSEVDTKAGAIQITVDQTSQNVIGVANQAASIGSAVDSANNTLGTVNTTTSNIQTAVNSLTATATGINTKANDMDVRLAELEGMVNTLQLSVEYQSQLDIQLKDIALEVESKGKDALTIKSFLAAFKENGMLVPVATGDVSVFAILDGGTPSAVPVDFVPTPIGGVVGIMRLDLDLTNFETMPKVLLIEASYNGNPGNINGAKLFTVGLHTE